MSDVTMEQVEEFLRGAVRHHAESNAARIDALPNERRFDRQIECLEAQVERHASAVEEALRWTRDYVDYLAPTSEPCPACSANGGLVDLSKSSFDGQAQNPDVLGVCNNCGAVKLSQGSERKLATRWCRCERAKGGEDQVYFYDESGAHGWVCIPCGQTRQAG